MKALSVDYGHVLEFGAFITPAAADPHTPVALAHLAEAAGLDPTGVFVDNFSVLASVAEVKGVAFAA